LAYPVGLGALGSNGRRAAAWSRKIFGAGVALAVLAGLSGSAEAASRKSQAYPRASKREAEKNPFGELSKSTLQLVVSIGHQRVTLYGNGVRVAEAPVSTGTPDRPTPTGVFSIIEKDRWHHSNLYGNAPMYYMQRLTWSGVAMHEGVLPGTPASHGCIRMPHDFAARLWGVTRLGVRIVVARGDVAPHDFSHPSLFAPKPKPEPGPADSPISADGRIAGLRPTLAVDAVLLTPTDIETAASIADGTGTTVAPPANARTAGDKRGEAALPIDDPAKPGAGSGDPRKPTPIKKADEPVKRNGQVAVFVSRKEKRIFVRQGFIPLFDLPVEIAEPDRPLGTHVFTALELQDNGTRMRWNVMSMAGEPPHAADRNGDTRRKSARSREPFSEPFVVDARPPSPAQALGRIQMPPEAVERIGELLIPGSSLVISDEGLGRETGRYTEFVVLTR
jgi:L,D-transpeptidase catalytic domain